ncbi:MAG: hypothetical protein COC24_018360 [Alphaproteobacteria bacterium]|nr:hypothetical protein [Alphaproteobacteria bacterium]
MIDFLIILLALTQIPIIFIYATQSLSHSLTQKPINTNPLWLEQNAEFNNHILLTKTFKYFSSWLAIFSLVAFIYFSFTAPNTHTLVALLLAPNFIWICGFGIYIISFQFLVVKRIPRSEIRSASMNNRQLRSYIPLWVIYAAYTALALIITIYIWAYFNQTIPRELAMRRLTGMGVFIIIISFMIYKSLKNKVSELEFIFGPNGRKIEIMINCGCLYIGVLLGSVLILSDIFNITIFTPLSFTVTAHLCIQIYFISYFFYTNAKNTHQTS